jgi:hypothetical protein
MSRDYIINGIAVLGLAIIVSLAWCGFPPAGGWSRFLGSVIFYTGIEILVWFIAHPQIREWHSLSLERARTRGRFPPE